MGRQLIWLVFGAGVAALANAAISELAVWIGDAQKWAVLENVHQYLHEKAIAVDLDFFENPEHQNTFHRALAKSTQRPAQVLIELMRAIRGALSVAGVIRLLWAFHWTFLALLVAAALPAAFVRLKYDRIRYRRGFEWTPLERKAWYYQRVMVDRLFALDIRLLQFGPHFLQRYNELRKRLRKEQWSLATRRSAGMTAADLAGLAIIYGSFAFVALQALRGLVSVGDFVLFYQTFLRGRDCLHDMLNAMGNLHEHGLFLSSFYDFLDMPRRVGEPERPRPTPRAVENAIVFEAVSFKYRDRDRNVLERLSLTLPAGKTVALVGENGAGKTTLVKLLCRLCDPTSGAISSMASICGGLRRRRCGR